MEYKCDVMIDMRNKKEWVVMIAWQIMAIMVTIKKNYNSYNLQE